MKDLGKFNAFIIRVYLKYWFTCQLPTKAPSNDLELLKELEHYKRIDKDVGEAAQRKLRGQLWYLNEANIALSFFDDEVTTEMKRKMVANLTADGHPETPHRVKLDVKNILSAELCDFVTNNTYLFFETILNENITGISKKILTTDPETWDENEHYIAAKAIVKNLLVVNDIAERGVALITRFNAILTHQEKQKQYILHAMEQHYRELPIQNYSKSKFIEYLTKNYQKATQND